MSKAKQLIKALRCSATAHKEGIKCEGCPYRLLEPYNDILPITCDVEIDGQRYYESCDCDRICMDAAGMLERIVNLAENLVE